MAILTDNVLDFVSTGVDQTERLGIRLGELLKDGDLLCLYGDLGAGKTALARGIGRGWGTAMRITSPTFTLVNEYPRVKDRLTLYHMDFYRLEGAGEIITTGIEDLLEANGARMIEWPERVEDFLPEDRLNVQLRHVSEFRRGMRFSAEGERHIKLLKEFRRSAFGV